MFLALKEIKHEKVRYGLIIAMIVMISYLMFILMGMMLGLANENKAALTTWDAHTVFLNKNANDNMGQSVITKDQLAGRSLNKHEALVGQTAAVMKRTQGKAHKESVQFIGLDAGQYIAKDNMPLVAGRHAKNKHELVADESLKAKGYQLGDKVKLNSTAENYRLMGFAKDSQLNVAPVVYGRLSTWRALRGVAPQVVASGIISNQQEGASRFKKLAHYPIDKFIQKLPGYSAENSTFMFMIGFLMVISLVIIAVFLYILTMQKMPNYAVLRAQGIPARHLVGATVDQAVILMVAGICGGLVLTLLTAWLMPMTVPLVLKWPLIGLISLVLILLGGIGALLPVRMIMKVDPVRALNS